MKQIIYLFLFLTLTSCSSIRVKRNGYYQTIHYRVDKPSVKHRPSHQSSSKPEVFETALGAKKPALEVKVPKQGPGTIDPVALELPIKIPSRVRPAPAIARQDTVMEHERIVQVAPDDEPLPKHWAVKVATLLLYLALPFMGLTLPFAVVFGLIGLEKTRNSTTHGGHKDAKLAVIVGSLISMLFLYGFAIYGGIALGLFVLLEILFLIVFIWAMAR